jgi:hypothetical protein
MDNLKTIKSLELSTNCPKRQAGHPCSYCYVETSRQAGFRAKIVHDRIPYNEEILRLKQDVVDSLNACGGLRIFSFGDYMSWMDEDLERVIRDARARKLKLKAITKQVDFVHKYHNDIDIINVSVDAMGEGVGIEVAKSLRQQYSNVRIRAAIMDPDDLEKLDWVDILTFNHARNGYHLFSRKEIADYAQRYPGKVCCETGRCATCTVRCGGLNEVQQGSDEERQPAIAL